MRRTLTSCRNTTFSRAMRHWEQDSGSTHVLLKASLRVRFAQSMPGLVESEHGRACEFEALIVKGTDSFSDTMELPSLDVIMSMSQKTIASKDLRNPTCIRLLVCYFGFNTLRAIKTQLIQMLSECLHGRLALHEFIGLIQSENHVPIFEDSWRDYAEANSRSLQVFLKASAASRDIIEGRMLHFQIIQGSFEADIFLGSALVDMYIKCGTLVDAVVVFNSLPVRDVVLWTTLIAGYAENGLNNEASNCLDRMRSEGLSPNSVTYLCSLKGFKGISDIEKAQRMHAELIKHGFETDVSVGSALVDMYGKCGSIAEVQVVFSKLAVRNAITWNTLISINAENSIGKGVLNLLYQMQLEGVCPDAVTFLCSLKGCGILCDDDRGKQMHAEIFKRGLELALSVGNALVDMYSKCGLFLEAHDVFNRLPTRNVVSWTALITGYVEHGFHKEALTCSEQMQLQDVFPDVITFVGCLKAASSQKDARRGETLHLQIIKEEFETDLFIGNALVDMYGQCGLLMEAYEIIWEMPVRDVVSWNALIAGLTEHGLGEDALICLRQMLEDSVLPDAVTFICSLKACTCTGDICKGQAIHAEITIEGYETDLCVGNTLIDMYFKCGSFLEACELFDELPDHDVASWTARISGYAEQGYGAEALSCLDEMLSKGFSPNSATFLCCLKASSSIRTIEKGQALHAEITRQGVEMEQNIGSSLVDMYAKCGCLVEARNVFDQLLTRDDVSFNAIMWGYAECGDTVEALRCMDQMSVEGVVPDGVTFSSILKACGAVGAVHRGQEVHSEIVKKALDIDAFVVGNLIDLYITCGLHAEAHCVSSRLPIQDIVSWNTLLSGYADHGDGEEAIKCYVEMQRGGMSPNEITYVCILKACGGLGALERGREIHISIVKDDYVTDPFIGNSLVDMYSKCGLPMEAQTVFEDLLDRDIVTWNALLAAYASQGESLCVFGSFKKMEGDGIEPNGTTLLSLLTACNHVGLIETGQKYFVASSKYHTHLLTTDHFNCMIDLLGRAGQLDIVKVVVEEMPLQPNRVTCSSVLSSCRKWKNINLGRWAFEQAVNLSQKEASTFVSMSNIFVEDYT